MAEVLKTFSANIASSKLTQRRVILGDLATCVAQPGEFPNLLRVLKYADDSSLSISIEIDGSKANQWEISQSESLMTKSSWNPNNCQHGR